MIKEVLKLLKEIFVSLGINNDWVYWDTQGVYTFYHEKGHDTIRGNRTIVKNRKSKILGKTQNYQNGYWNDGEFKHLSPIYVSEVGCNKCFQYQYDKDNRERKINDLLDDKGMDKNQI